MKRNDMQVENIPIVVVAACVLHNVCKVHNETFDDSWLASTNDDALPQPQATNHDSGSVASARPKEIQEALVNFFHLHPL